MQYTGDDGGRMSGITGYIPFYWFTFLVARMA